MYTIGVPRKNQSDAAEVTPVTFPRRAENARRTHQALVTAAADLFARAGYQATTIQAIADRAAVARPTVFTSVPGGKPQLLKEARDQALAGDDEPVPVPQRSWFRDAMSQSDPRELLRLQAGNYRLIHQRAARLERALATAAESDAALAELDQQARRQRHHGATLVAERLDHLGVLSATITDAADILYAITAPDLYLLLTEDRAWTPDAYQHWLTSQLQHALLPP
jgi:AcrR family transcriptional regulator